MVRQHFGYQEHLVAPTFDGFADDSFRQAGSVQFRRVDMRQAEVESAAQRRDGSLCSRSFAFPGSLPDARDLAPGSAEDTHDIFSSHGFCSIAINWRTIICHQGVLESADNV